MTLEERALVCLRQALGRNEAEFRAGQWESIEAILKRQRLLVVERTGWGKSMIYFLATRLLRDEGAGLTILVSPLLSLMRNQLEAAARLGIRAETINSANQDHWDGITQKIREDSLDVLIISPERLGNPGFKESVLGLVRDRVGLFVVDEAHCISDWGHDFRPDYRRIIQVLQSLPAETPVLATTATANNRVVSDVLSQLGTNIRLIRGPLIRESLRLQTLTLRSPAARMAWLAQTIPALPGSGIVYTLTQRDAEQVAGWLTLNGIVARAYHSGLGGDENGESSRDALEHKLLRNEIKVLVATVALGMGFDKPDLGFVIHYQHPASVVHYYQQVGRAGRSLDLAYGILLSREEDDSIADYFINNAFPPQKHVTEVLAALIKAGGGLSVRELEGRINLKHLQIDKALRFLAVETPPPVVKCAAKWKATEAATAYRMNHAYIQAITAIRRQEQAQMRAYINHPGCLMEFLARALDDPQARPCGRCARCQEGPLLDPAYSREIAIRAELFLKDRHPSLAPRKQWPAEGALPTYGFTGRIDETLCAREGRALSIWKDGGWGEKVADGKYGSGLFDDDLIKACEKLIREWNPSPALEWVTCIPSLKRADLVPDFSSRLATALGLPFLACLKKEKDNPPQKTMQNSFQQAHNLDGVFSTGSLPVPEGPCLLVDDVTDSGWTLNVAAAVLRRAGCSAVYPLALALNSLKID